MRAALVALRDCGVTEGVKDAGRDALYMSDPGLTIDDAFRAMLDAALKGE